MLAEVVRSGLVEATHHGAVAAVGPDLSIIAGSGEVDRPFFFRSAAKPIQAGVCQELGAALSPQQLAVAAASHDGLPVHLALVEEILSGCGLSESALGCPAAWPLAGRETRRLVAAGHGRPRRLWHNCSGKHAAMLAACVAQGWAVDAYLGSDHPLQEAIAAAMAEATGEDPGPTGVDGCGAPVFRGSALGLARLYASVAARPRWGEVLRAMQAYPVLVSGPGNADTAIGVWLDAAAKRGAEGSFGVAVRGRAGVAVKCWDGNDRAASVGMLEALRQLGMTAGAASDRLVRHARPVVRGGGEPVGWVEPRVSLA